MSGMDARVWTEIRRRARRARTARRLVRWVFGPEVTAVEQAELDALYGYVTLWNDVQPVIDTAWTLLLSQYATNTGSVKSPPPLPEAFTHYVRGQDLLALTDAFSRYHDLYPEHRRPAGPALSGPAEPGDPAGGDLP